ncbi:MAG: FtsW-like cell division membrane protein CA_C0505, partial [uncultured Solirubrobacteraceae bacterium]
ERPQPGARRPRPRLPPRHRRLPRGLPVPGRRALHRRPQPGRALEPVAHHRRRLPGPVPGRPRRPALHAPARGPVRLPAGGRARLLRPRRDLPHRPGARARAGAVVRGRARPLRGDDRLPARLPQARALPLHDRGGRALPAPAPARPGHRPAVQRRVPRRGDRARLLPAGRAREDRDRRLPGGLPQGHAAGARARRAAHPGHHVPAAQALRARARDLGGHDVHARLHPRPRVVADVLRRVPRAALRRDEPAVVRDDRPRPLRARRVVHRVARRPHPARHRAGRGPREHLARPVREGRRREGGLPARPVAVRAGRRRAVRDGLRPGAHRPARQDADPPGRRDGPHLRGDRQRAGARRRLRAHPRLPAVRRAGLQDRAARARLVLQAAGHGPHRGARAPGVRHRRGRHPRDPADGRDAPVRLLRGLVDRGELHPARPAADGLRPRAQRGARGRV